MGMINDSGIQCTTMGMINDSGVTVEEIRFLKSILFSFPEVKVQDSIDRLW